MRRSEWLVLLALAVLAATVISFRISGHGVLVSGRL